MKFVTLVLAAFLGGLLAIVVALAWKSSQETGKSLQASFVDVPGEAQRLASDARTRVTEKANASWVAIKEKEAEIAKKIPGRGGDDTEMVEETVVAGAEEVAEAV